MFSGDTIGKYRLINRLGKGGMGEVWLATASGHGGFTKTVVIKTLLPEYACDPLFIDMLSNEARICAKLSHPNLIEVFDFTEHGGIYLLAMEHVAGYACYNDGSIRDWQRHTSQFTPGKNFLGTGGFGPWMVTTDEIPDVSKQRIATRVNGMEVQAAPLSDLVFDVPALIAYCSTFTELVPGDVVVTGTTGGVGAYRVPPLWLKHGDVVEVEVSGIGILRNPVKDEVAAATRAA